ncbi:sulfotransferase family protein, partial [Mycobacterium sp.]|uniref:sulfotransferase family protein n=1 Tax=Mycobacterium sp. TaxID=1785 RepID=UPI003F9B5570
MPRSGTSALARVLALCGATLPAGMKGADRANPRGYWEPRQALHLNDAILRRHGSAAFDTSLRLQEEGAFDAEEKAACIAEIGAFLTTLPAAPLVLIKENRITLLSGVWFEAARLAGLDIAVVIPVRHPQEVTASGAAALRASPELSSALWLKYNLLAERHTRALPRVFVDYANLLDDWRREITRISAALAIDLNTRDEGAIEEFLTPDLQRQRHCGPVTDRFGTDWMSAVYEALRAAARDEPWDGSALDRVFEAYRASEHDFRTA